MLFFIVSSYAEVICAPRTPRTMSKVEGNERTESRGWGKVKAIVYNIIVAKRIVSISHPTCKNFSKFSIVFNA